MLKSDKVEIKKLEIKEQVEKMIERHSWIEVEVWICSRIEFKRGNNCGTFSEQNFIVFALSSNFSQAWMLFSVNHFIAQPPDLKAGILNKTLGKLPVKLLMSKKQINQIGQVVNKKIPKALVFLPSFHEINPKNGVMKWFDKVEKKSEISVNSNNRVLIAGVVIMVLLLLLKVFAEAFEFPFDFPVNSKIP